MKIIQQDLLTVTEGILFHQVNCQGVMGGGIARALALKFPGLEAAYRELCKKYEFDETQLLGKVFLYRVNDTLLIANVFGQGQISRSTRMTSYDATVEAFERITRAQERTPNSSFTLHADRFYFPYNMGCGLGGGDWSIYSAIIDRCFPNAIICQHNV
jgi:O-acetyl-ADP-ribose deacetylase (regulator of RNase III)